MNKIETEEEYQKALERLYNIMHAEEGTPESDEADNLADRIEEYEKIHYPID